MAEFKESEHPRDKDGKFTDKNSTAKSQQLKELRTSRTGGWNQDTFLIHPRQCSPVSSQSPIILLNMANLVAITNQLGWESENRSPWDA